MSGYAPREVRKVPNEVPKWPTAVGAPRRTAVHHLVLDRSRSSRNRCPIGNAGAAYVVWGQRGASPDLDLAELGERAVRIAGANEQDSLGSWLPA
jgi:hypothetical protein